MGIRVLLEGRPYLVAGVAIVLVVVSAFASFRTLTQGAHPELPQVQTKSFYTCDDGATVFEDEVSLVPPFDHGGKPAVRAYVFSCDGGRHRWVQYLEKYTDLAKQQVEGKAPVGDQDPGPMAGLRVKKPGSGDWMSSREPKAIALMSPQCPDGSGSAPVQVFP